MKNYSVREMTGEDVHAVLQIERATSPAPWSDNAFLSEIHKTRSLVRVALTGETIVGYICAERIEDEGHILNLAVHPRYQRMSIASLLLKTVIAELTARTCHSLFLEVRCSNNAAQKLYEGFGFAPVGERKKYYSGPAENAVVMMLDLRKYAGSNT